MKRKLLFIALACGLAAMVSAQQWGRGWNPPGPTGPQRGVPAAETVTISGSLIISHGSPAVKSGDDTYLLSGISRLIGFVDGLKEGAQVTIEGAAITSPRDSNLKFLRPAKLTFGGKVYDLTPPVSGFGLNRQLNPPPGTLRQFAPPAPNRQGFCAPQRNYQPRQPMAPRQNRR